MYPQVLHDIVLYNACGAGDLTSKAALWACNYQLYNMVFCVACQALQVSCMPCDLPT